MQCHYNVGKFFSRNRRSNDEPTIPVSHETAPASPESVSSSSSVPTTPASSDDEPEWPEAMPDAVPEAADRQVTGSENFLTEFSTDFHQTIVDGYKDDSKFSKELVAGVEVVSMC